MDSVFLRCPICYEEFNLTDHLARMLPSCGHSICCECLKTLLENPKEQQKRCPIDKERFPSGLFYVDAFKPNYVVKDMLDALPKTQLCPDHDEEMNLICFSDQKKLCCICLLEGSHQSHNVKSMKTLKLQANSQARKVREALNNLEICHSKVRHTLTEKEKLLLDGVKREFQAIKKCIADKEQDILYQIKAHFYNQEQILDSLIGSCSSTRTNLDSDAFELDNIFKDEGLFKNQELFQRIQDHIANCHVKVSSQVLEEETKTIKLKIEETLQTLNRLWGSKVQDWPDFQFDSKKNNFRNLARGILKDLPPDQVATEEDPFVVKLNTSFNFKYDQERSQFVIGTQECHRDQILNIGQLKEVKDVNVILAHTSMVDQDYEVLNFVWRKIKATSRLSIDLNLSSEEKYQKVLEQIGQTELAFSKIQIIGEKLDFSFGDDARLLGRILSQCKNLEEIQLRLKDAKLNKSTLQDILQDVLRNGAKIKDIRLFLKRTDLDDDGICELDFNFSQIKCLHLFLNKTKVTNRLIEWLGKKFSKSMSRLETFRLSLEDTLITDDFMDDLFSAFGKIKDLTLHLGCTKITDKTLKALSLAMPSFADTIERFSLWLRDCNVTDEGISSICMSLPNIEKLYLLLNNTKITDNTIQLLAQKTWSSATKLRCLVLFLSNTGVTDESMGQVFETLPKLEKLGLALESTKVTDNSIEPFMIDKGESLKGNLYLNVKSTKVSQSVQEKIKAFETLSSPYEWLK